MWRKDTAQSATWMASKIGYKKPTGEGDQDRAVATKGAPAAADERELLISGSEAVAEAAQRAQALRKAKVAQ